MKSPAHNTGGEQRIRRHPSRQHLMAYAEVLADGRSPVPAGLAAHVNFCPQCNREVRAMTECFRFLANAPAVEPKTDLAAQILMEARKARAAARPPRRFTALINTAKFLACAASLTLFASLIFTAVLRETGDALRPASGPALAAAPEISTPLPTPEELRSQVAALSAAMNSLPEDHLSPREREQFRALSRLRADLAAAQAALERNPGHPRAAQLMYASLQQQAAALRDLYLQREL